MNIFVTDRDPLLAAQALDNKRLVKMVLETAQMISTIMRSFGFNSNCLYKPTHANHPCTRWGAESYENFMWLLTHGWGLASEYTYRYKRAHKSSVVFVEAEMMMRELVEVFPAQVLTEHPIATAWDDLRELEVTEAYRETMRRKWADDKRPPQWGERGPPEWYNSAE